jgi:hypothetical protein
MNPTTGDDEGVGQPKMGDRFRCTKCGMALEITADCRCDTDCPVHLHCCGQEMEKV